MSNLYKAVSLQPFSISDKNNEKLNKGVILEELKRDVENLALLTQWHIYSDDNLLKDLEEKLKTNPQAQNSVIGRMLGITLPVNITAGRSGKSRFERMLQDRVVRESKSWLERVKVKEKTTKKYVSQGWKRTANLNKPNNLKPKMSLSATDNQYSKISNDPFQDGFIILELVVNGFWRKFFFDFDLVRFNGAAKVCLPDIVVKNNQVYFNFAVEYSYNYSPISSDYILGVDVGKSQYATVSVVRLSNQEIVHTSTLSQRVHSLWNSIKATERQIKSLTLKKINNPIYDNYFINREISENRSKNSRKKKELAILAAQEIAEIAHIWDNAAVSVEDLSWIDNTMQNGRWNRGEFVKKLTEYVELNGSRVFKVSAYNTSQFYYKTGIKGTFRGRTFISSCGVEIDRDVNAAANIALRLENSLHKIVFTRSKAKKFTPKITKRTPITRNSLKYPGRDRTKNSPTPKRTKTNKKKREVNFDNKCSSKVEFSENNFVLEDASLKVSEDSRTLKQQHDNRHYSNFMLLQ